MPATTASPSRQFFQIGNFLYPNNLPANAHGNGYADPNTLIPLTIDGVTVDGGAFNVREGNNSIDLAATYIPRQRVNSFFQLTGDYRDADAHRRLESQQSGDQCVDCRRGLPSAMDFSIGSNTASNTS